jgi:hypothetical protein
VSSRRRRSSSRAIRTRIVCSARASRRATRVLHFFENNAPPGSRSPGHRLVQVPLQCAVELDALADKAFAVVDEQPQVQLRSVQVRGGETLQGLLQRGAGDVESVDRVRLAALAGALAAPRGQVRGDPQHPLAALDQEPLARPRDMPAVLKRPHPLAVEPARPLQQRAEPAPAGTVRSPSSSPVPAATAAIVCERL